MVIKLVGKLLYFVGGASFAAFLLVRFFTPPADWEMPLPLEPFAAMGPAGEVFVVQDSQRMQKYDSAGQFQTAWAINPGGGLWNLLIQSGQVVVCSTRGGARLELFDLDGKPLEGADPPISREDCFAAERQAWAEHGARGWTIRDEAGARSVMISRHWWHYLMISPFFSFFVLMIGAALTYAGRVDDAREF